MYAALHGHSKYSDGLNSPQEIIIHAVQKQISYIALTDHQTVAGIPEFYESATSHNQKFPDLTILPIAGIEAKFKQGEIIFLKPAPFNQTKQFLEWCEQKLQKSDGDCYITTQEAIEKFEVLVIIPHPNMTFHSLSYEDINNLYAKIPKEKHAHIAIEIHNGAASFMGNLNAKRENKLKKFCIQNKYNMIANPDYHHINQLTTGISKFTNQTKHTPNYEYFVKTFKERSFTPIISHPGHIQKLKIITILARAFARDHWGI